MTVQTNTPARLLAAGALIAIAAPAAAGTDVLTFSGLEHGRIITDSTFADEGITIRATNFRLPGASPIIFDTQFINTADPDLEGPPWGGGNLPIDTVLGNVIIVPENLVDDDDDGIVDSPDDEGARPAGILEFTFDTPTTEFGFDLIDIEGVVTEMTRLDFFIGGELAGSASLTDLITPGSDFFDETVAFGNNSLNRIAPFQARDFIPKGLGDGPGNGPGPIGFDRVEISLGGSGAIDNVVTNPVPSPGSAVLLGLGGLAAARRRR
ncbi:MAG: hypothetical protein AAGF47_11655 [Planctomycetota bacterium]